METYSFEMKKLVLTSVVFLGFIACTNKPVNENFESNMELLHSILAQPINTGKFFIVDAQTNSGHIDFTNKNEVKKRKKYIKNNLNISDYDISDLLDYLFEVNKISFDINIESNKKKGYIIDHDNKYNAYFEKGGGGWDRLYEENPNVLGITYVSVPVFDRQNGIALVFKATQKHGKAGVGSIIVYEFKNEKLTKIDSLIIWKS